MPVPEFWITLANYIGLYSLVALGLVPPSQHDVMRAPFQEGRFPFPVKYGYANVGVVEAGDLGIVGREVFCLFPHQTGYVVPRTAVTPWATYKGSDQSLGGRRDALLNRCTCMSTSPGIR